jgi:hypothetical protein
MTVFAGDKRMTYYDQRIQKPRDFYLSEEKDFLLGVQLNPQTPNLYPNW